MRIYRKFIVQFSHRDSQGVFLFYLFKDLDDNYFWIEPENSDPDRQLIRNIPIIYGTKYDYHKHLRLAEDHGLTSIIIPLETSHL